MLPLPFLPELLINDSPRVRQVCQPSQMLEVIDGGSGGILRKNRGVEPHRATDLPDGAPKCLRRRAASILGWRAMHILNPAPRARFAVGDQFGGREAFIPGNATLFESLFHSRGERDLPTVLGRPMLAFGKCTLP